MLPFQRAGPRVPISTNGGGSPRWRHDGKELFYIRGDNTLMAVAVSLNAASLDVGQPARCSRLDFVRREFPIRRHIGWTFLVNRSVDDETPSGITRRRQLAGYDAEGMTFSQAKPSLTDAPTGRGTRPHRPHHVHPSGAAEAVALLFIGTRRRIDLPDVRLLAGFTNSAPRTRLGSRLSSFAGCSSITECGDVSHGARRAIAQHRVAVPALRGGRNRDRGCKRRARRRGGLDPAERAAGDRDPMPCRRRQLYFTYSEAGKLIRQAAPSRAGVTDRLRSLTPAARRPARRGC